MLDAHTLLHTSTNSRCISSLGMWSIYLYLLTIIHTNIFELLFDNDSYVDNDKGFDLTRSAQRYYSRIGARTQVLPASLISIAEVMMLGGAHHITVSPPLLAELASTPHTEPTDNQAKPWFQSNELDEAAAADYQETVADEALYRIQFTRSKSGANEKKLVDAINIFCEMQSSLEALVQKYM